MSVRHILLRLRQGLRRHWRVLLLVLLAGAGVIVAVPHLKAWHHYQTGQSALERYHADEALAHFRSCLQIWPQSGRVLLLAARAARQAGDLDEAVGYLEECQKRLGPSEEVLLEWTLQQAAAGELASVEPYLRSRLQKAFLPQGPLICEALVVGYLRMNRFLDAHTCLNYWLEQQPDHIQALFLRATGWRARQRPQKAAADYRRVLELDPTRRDAREALVSCLLDADVRAYVEALPLVEELLSQRPDDADVLVLLALCREGLGQAKEARAILDRVLQEHPDHVLALRERGRLALQDGQATEAEHWLRRGLAVLPDDFAANNSLLVCLEQQGKTGEAQLQRDRVEQLKTCLKRLREITEYQISRRPYDPALYCEIGILNLRLGHADLGHRWLLLALSQDANYRPAHAALVEYYQKRGDTERAAPHRRLAQEDSDH
jgi:tetratricopeptide (TPR) repeat protein